MSFLEYILKDLCYFVGIKASSYINYFSNYILKQWDGFRQWKQILTM